MSDYTSTAATQQPVTVDEVKAHLNITHTADDALLAQYISAATATLEARCNRCFVAQTRICKMDSFADSRYVHNRRVYPPRSPLLFAATTDVEIKYVDTAGTTTTLASSDYVVSSGDRPGFIAESYNATWPSVYAQPNAVTVTYVTGHSTGSAGVPVHIKLAVQQLVAHWYRHRESHVDGTLSELPLGVTALLEAEHLETYG